MLRRPAARWLVAAFFAAAVSAAPTAQTTVPPPPPPQQTTPPPPPTPPPGAPSDIIAIQQAARPDGVVWQHEVGVGRNHRPHQVASRRIDLKSGELLGVHSQITKYSRSILRSLDRRVQVRCGPIFIAGWNLGFPAGYAINLGRHGAKGCVGRDSLVGCGRHTARNLGQDKIRGCYRNSSLFNACLSISGL